MKGIVKLEPILLKCFATLTPTHLPIVFSIFYCTPVNLYLNVFNWVLNFYTGQPPRFTLEPQDAVLPTTRNNEALNASIHCAHDSPNTTLTWYRDSVQINSGGTRIIHANGTLQFRPVIADADLTEEGVEYHCRLSNAFGSVISRTAILKLASKLTCCVHTMLS